MKRIFVILTLFLFLAGVIGCGGNVGAGYYHFYDHTKYSGNPVFPYGDDEWDYNKHYPSVIYNSTWPSESQFRMWYAGYNYLEMCTCYAYSSNGINWTKPNLGLIEYEGSSDNNIILDLGIRQVDAFYDNGVYVLLIGEDTNKLPTTQHAVDVYTSTHPTNNFTLVKELPVKIGPPPGIFHGMDIERRTDGRWYAYYQYRDESNYRSIGAYLSDTTDLDGDWTDLGVLIEEESVNEQRYAIDVFRYDDKYHGAVLNYGIDTELTEIELWDSNDGETWRRLAEWIEPGDEGEWDKGLLTNGTFIDLGDSWRYYYSGGQKDHSELQRLMAVGYVHNATATPNYLSTEDGKAIMTHDGKYIYIG